MLSSTLTQFHQAGAAFFGVSEELLLDVSVTLVLLLLYFPLQWLLIKWLLQRVKSRESGEVIEEAGPQLLRLLVLAVLLKVWFSGRESVLHLMAISEPFGDKLIASFYVFLVYRGLLVLICTLINIRTKEDSGKKFVMARYAQIAVGVVSAFFLFRIWLASTADFSTYFGLVSAGIAIALQDVITSLAGWVYIIALRPFQIGDRVQIAEHRGDITDIGLFQFSMMETGHWVAADQATCRVLSFPNSFVFKNVVANYHMGFEYIFSEMPVMVTFESNWKRALSTLEAVLAQAVGGVHIEAERQIRRASRMMRIAFVHLEPRVITSVADSGVVLTMRFLCPITERRFLEEKVWKAVLEAFSADDGIDFAYPTQRYYDNRTEGKPGAGGS